LCKIFITKSTNSRSYPLQYSDINGLADAPNHIKLLATDGGMVVVGPSTLDHRVKGLNPAATSTGREEHITKNQIKLSPTNGGTVVGPSTLEHKVKGLNPSAASTEREEHIKKSNKYLGH